MGKKEIPFLRKCNLIYIRFGKVDVCENKEQEFRAAKVSFVP